RCCACTTWPGRSSTALPPSKNGRGPIRQLDGSPGNSRGGASRVERGYEEAAARARNPSQIPPRESTMTTKCRPRPEPFFPDLEPLADLLRTPPATTADRVQHIRALGERIAGYVRTMCAAAGARGSSAEEAHRAIAVFYERLRATERELGRIHENFRLA